MVVTAHIGEGGRLVIPATLRKALALRPGDEVVILLEDDGLRILTRGQAVRTARALVRRYVELGRSLVDELAAGRHAEAANE
jgi:AbrB family looped-hinge helix DNA binding protein